MSGHQNRYQNTEINSIKTFEIKESNFERINIYVNFKNKNEKNMSKSPDYSLPLKIDSRTDDIYNLIDLATKDRLAILLVSTDFEEVSLMAHRALVFSEGKIVQELNREEINIENLVKYASRANVGVGI